VGKLKLQVTAPAPRLEELSEHEAPCLLWDSDRRRFIWANRAGLDLFRAETLFDLLDRAFDNKEPAVVRLNLLRGRLKNEASSQVTLNFPSIIPEAQIHARCSLHRLEDGREGILVVGEIDPRLEQVGSVLELAEGFIALPLAAIIVDENGWMRHANAEAKEQLAHLEESSLAAWFGEEPARDFVLRVKRGLVSEIRRADTNIGRRELRLTARKLGDSAGAINAFVLMFEDVTERRALEQALSKRPTFAPGSTNETSMRDAAAAEASPPSVPAVIRKRLDSIEEAICIVRGGRVLFANERALKLLQARTIESLGQRIVSSLTSSEESLLDFGEGAASSSEIELNRSTVPWHLGPAVQVKLKVRPKEPMDHRHERQAPPAQRPEAVEQALARAELKDFSWKPDDAELSAILDTASDGIITLDMEGRIRSFSAGAEAIFGQRKAEVLGRALTDLLTPDTQKTFRDYLAALTDSGLAAVFNDGREVSANVGPGKHLPLFLTISRINVEAKESEARPAFCAVVRDITQWKQTEAELRGAKEKAEETSRQKSEFLARISHELRTPLNAILGFSEVMRLERFGKLQNEKYRDYVSDIHASGAHLLSLINDLLDLSKVEAGKLELTFISVNLAEITEHAMRLLSERAQQLRVSLKRNFPPNLPNVVADLRSMRQIMINLLSNSIKFTDPGGQVMVSARLTKVGELVLRVKDTGIGMNEEQLKEALEPFRQVTSSTRPEREGTGLGLPLTKALVEANRASFSISSAPGRGTAVDITYPTTRVLAD
jgi:PAS domain S-box-containing protein